MHKWKTCQDMNAIKIPCMYTSNSSSCLLPYDDVILQSHNHITTWSKKQYLNDAFYRKATGEWKQLNKYCSCVIVNIWCLQGINKKISLNKPRHLVQVLNERALMFSWMLQSAPRDKGSFIFPRPMHAIKRHRIWRNKLVVSHNCVYTCSLACVPFSALFLLNF